MKVRKIFRHELNAAFRDAASQSKPFVYPVSARYTEDIYTESNGVMIGKLCNSRAVMSRSRGKVCIDREKICIIGMQYFKISTHFGLY